VGGKEGGREGGRMGGREGRRVSLPCASSVYAVSQSTCFLSYLKGGREGVFSHPLLALSVCVLWDERKRDLEGRQNQLER